ncbi:MAG: hypothetical protein K6T63_08450 [Alicyclobacillus herbarius]|uniref:hypothetical protein n=1 Tax=Alicyclobacillus herbarius TaxID=122960 RepID=UPI000416B7EF|nr:hypothetical protein [Alicyclobacillus herbarius]MCL6632654.1 hypothetical protein [Alicyclobacillus herbarius]
MEEHRLNQELIEVVQQLQQIRSQLVAIEERLGRLRGPTTRVESPRGIETDRQHAYSYGARYLSPSNAGSFRADWAPFPQTAMVQAQIPDNYVRSATAQASVYRQSEHLDYVRPGL